MLLRLSYHELRMSEAGPSAGFLWSFGEPALLFLVLGLVFRSGVRAGEIGGVPYGDWFLAGYLPWQMVSRTVGGSAGIFRKHRAVLRQIRFPAEILPLLPAITSFWIHLFLLFLFCLMTGEEMGQGTWPLLLTAMLEMSVLSVGLAYLVATLCVCLPLFAPLVSVLMQIWFWATPLAWQEQTTDLPVSLCANPLRGIVGNYRGALLGTGVGGLEAGDILLHRSPVTLPVLAAGILLFVFFRGEIPDMV